VENHNAEKLFGKLVQIIKTLREPGGCPWDREQTLESMSKFVVEESNEVVEAIKENDPLHICEELGDLTMIIVFLARIAAEMGTFSISEVLEGIVKKLIARHPHVFFDRERITSEGVVAKWKILKAEEKKKKGRISSRMEEAQRFVSAISAALAVQKEAQKVGFDFPSIEPAIAKVLEETAEVGNAQKGKNRRKLRVEIGDLIFAAINVSRLLKVDPEKALRASTLKFVKRFSKVEKHFSRKGGILGRSIQELDSVWEQTKKAANPKGRERGKKIDV